MLWDCPVLRTGKEWEFMRVILAFLLMRAVLR